MTGKFKHIMETQYKINGRFQTQEVTDFGNDYTWENVYNATCADTLKWFRKIGSKQRVTQTVKNGKYIITIYSYAPHDDKLRNKIVFEEI